ncbi:hypothetical protein B4135_2856 [Caldibacillus debilis]|uniref:Uncharacterized protein n=1 Tax=Caldibacillus debilis TaxID=301148 RepID=A0A150LQV1_9BACI|nr:hypothetical protein B4135_2856 [Caldibacillus debilis]
MIPYFILIFIIKGTMHGDNSFFEVFAGHRKNPKIFPIPPLFSIASFLYSDSRCCTAHHI